MLVAGIVAFVLVWFTLSSLLFSFLPPPQRRVRTRSRRRGGYIKPPASSTQKATVIQRPWAQDRSVSFSSSLAPGDPSGGLATRLTQPPPNRPTVPGSSGNATAEAGESGVPLGDAA